jgi:NAD(P)-dependent dehydrogenase (short-subunit alcohol dehydrogenase family)
VNAALPLLRETPGARIVNTASVAGVFGAPNMAVYCATKFGVRGLTEALDIEFSKYGVRVVSLMPWFIDTAILDGLPAGANDGSNRRIRDALTENKTAIYPVSMAAERAWDAAHGADIHYMVGKEAERARFFARFFPRRHAQPDQEAVQQHRELIYGERASSSAFTRSGKRRASATAHAGEGAGGPYVL